MPELIARYFPDLTLKQQKQLDELGILYPEWNARINVISRKDIDQLYLHHILHSLSIARIISFNPGTSIMDAGTGGGFPGIPLAILFPEVQFTLVDSIGKKIKVTEAIVAALGLTNVLSLNARFEQVGRNFDFITGRAVSNIPLFFSQVRTKVKKERKNSLPNGILYLTGGELEPDLKGLPAESKIHAISGFFDEPYFQTKRVVHLFNIR